jgi:1,4-dihydroxy-6-naphthoate synthase
MINGRLKLAISPCPNDTFIFGAWINEFIDTASNIRLDIEYHDIQELNECALNNLYDIIKISASHIPKVISNYSILSTGGALTDHTGPLLISNKALNIDDIHDYSIVLPGKDTTAAFLFKFLYPECKNLDYRIFSEIEGSVLQHEFDAGVIIHESRFTYESKGLTKIADLGEEWFRKTQCPVPLGVIAVKRSIDFKVKLQIQEQIKSSIQWAQQHYPQLLPFIQSKATELSPETIRQHIDLYVNNYSIDLGESGRRAILDLIRFLDQKKLTPADLFI